MTLQHPNQSASRRERATSALAVPVYLTRPAARRAGWRVIFFSALCLAMTLASKAADSYSTAISKHLAMETEISTHADRTGTDVEKPGLADLKRAVMDEVQALPHAPGGQRIIPPAPDGKNSVPSKLVLPMTGLLILGTVGYFLKRRFDSMISASDLAEHRARQLLAEDPALAAFFNELRDGLNASGPSATVTPTDPINADSLQTDEVTSAVSTDLTIEFFASAPDQLANLRKLFSDFSRAVDEASRKDIILEFLRQIGALKDIARPSGLRPVWLMACALEGLLKQLSRDASEVTPSVLRTTAGAVDLLEALCVRDLNPNLATEPPVHLLAVDDDPISRLAISYALKKAFDAPDLAPNGEAALTLAAQQTYDVIFLDVDMPGIDGYELCTKIRQTARHRTTPVVFVTRHGDFNSRAKSTLSGGESLIAKPFLAFEITVKALTLALRGRLQNNAVTYRSISEEALTAAPSAPSSAGQAGPNAKEKSAFPKALESHPDIFESSTPDELSFSALVKASEDGSLDAVLARAPAFLKHFQSQLLAAQTATGQPDLKRFLNRLCSGIRSFNVETDRAELRAASKLGSVLESMLNKLVQHPQLCSPSALEAANNALALLAALCSQAGVTFGLPRSAVRILIVDDDPIARRAISGSIQLVFGRPDNAENGNAAVAAAKERQFDLIFLDVVMPGIDGFATCKQIRETTLNRETPVVFITSHDDKEARSHAMDLGGNGFISKPVLASQITLTALTFILRAHFDKHRLPEPEEKADCLVEA